MANIDEEPLLNGDIGNSQIGNGRIPSDRKTEQVGWVYRMYKGRFRRELWDIISLAWGLVLTNFSEMFLPTMSTIFLGHVGSTELSAAALVNAMMNVFCVPVIMGLSTACDTYFSQAYGRGQKGYIGVLLQRSFAIIFLVCVVIAGIFTNTESILLLIGMDPEAAYMAEVYMTIFIPGMFGLATYIILTKYMAVQNRILASVVIVGLGIGICAIVDYILVIQLNMGVIGAALGQDFACISMALMSLSYIYFTKLYKDTWTGWSSDMLLGWGDFFFLGLKGMLLFCVEYWIWVILVVAAGYLGTVELGAQEVFYNIEAIFVTLGLGVGDATSIRVGQELGAGNVEMVIVATRVSYTFVGCCACVVSIIIGCLRYVLPKLYTNIPAVVELTASMMPLVSYLIFADSLSYTGQGVFRGGGFQGAAFLIVVSTYYLIVLPISLSLMFLTDLGTTGGWLGLCLGVTIASSIFFISTHFVIDWHKAANKASQRINGGYYDLETDIDSKPVTQTTKEDSALIPGPEYDSYSLDKLIREGGYVTPELWMKRKITCGCIFLFFVLCIILRVATPKSGVPASSALNATESSVTDSFMTTLSPQISNATIM